MKKHGSKFLFVSGDFSKMNFIEFQGLCRNKFGISKNKRTQYEKEWLTWVSQHNDKIKLEMPTFLKTPELPGKKLFDCINCLGNGFLYLFDDRVSYTTYLFCNEKLVRVYQLIKEDGMVFEYSTLNDYLSS